MKKIQGKDVNVLYQIGQTWNTLAFSRSCSFTTNRKMENISSSQTGEAEEVTPGRYSWSMSIGCLLSDVETTVINAYLNKTKLKVKWNIDSEGATNLEGYAYIKSIEQQANIHDMASFNVTLQGTGEITVI